MAVAFDAQVSVQGSGTTSITSGAFTISGTNRAAIAHLNFYSNSTTFIVVTIGALSATAISGADTGTTVGQRSLCFGLTAPATGSQTVHSDWSGLDGGPTLGVITATGVDQTTSFNNGNFSTGSLAANSLTITSTSGDLTSTCEEDELAAAATSNQTRKWSQTFSGGGDIGPGTGTTTHTWTRGSAGTTTIAGANFVQAVTLPVMLRPHARPFPFKPGSASRFR